MAPPRVQVDVLYVHSLPMSRFVIPPGMGQGASRQSMRPGEICQRLFLPGFPVAFLLLTGFLFVIEFHLVLGWILLLRIVGTSIFIKKKCHDASDDHNGAEKCDFRPSVRDKNHHDRKEKDKAEKDIQRFRVFHDFIT